MEYIISDLKGKDYSLYYMFNTEISQSKFSFSKSTVTIFDDIIDEELSSNIKRIGSSFVNLKEGVSLGNNSLLKELSKYFRHFGIRFIELS